MSAAKPRVLYIEGEPRWEFKFIRRAAERGRSLELVTMLRHHAQQDLPAGIGSPQELGSGFPRETEELFAYQGLIIGSVEAGYFTASQQDQIREFAGRRGGGVALSGRPFRSGGGRLGARRGGRAAAGTAAGGAQHLPPRPIDAGADARGQG